jgi:hypothetical protein
VRPVNLLLDYAGYGKRLFSSESYEKKPAGAKAKRLFYCIYGTTEVMP